MHIPLCWYNRFLEGYNTLKLKNTLSCQPFWYVDKDHCSQRRLVALQAEDRDIKLSVCSYSRVPKCRCFCLHTLLGMVLFSWNQARTSEGFMAWGTIISLKMSCNMWNRLNINILRLNIPLLSTGDVIWTMWMLQQMLFLIYKTIHFFQSGWITMFILAKSYYILFLF